MKVATAKIICIIFLLLPITTLIQGIEIFSSVNRVLYGAMLVFLAYELFGNLTRRRVVVFILLSASYVFAFINTGGMAYKLNDVFYFVLWVFLCFFGADEGEEIVRIFSEELHGWTEFTLFVWSVLIFVSALFPSSYHNSSANYSMFESFSNSGFRVATSALLALTFLLLLVRANSLKRYLLYLSGPLFCAFFCGSRTYFVLILALCLIILYFYCSNFLQFLFLCLLGGIAAVLFFYNSPMGDKFLAADTENEYLGSLGTMTSARSIFWVADWEAMQEVNWYYKIFGKGFNFVYDVNVAAIGSKIYAHNDFLNLYMNFGIFGVALYLYSFFTLAKKLFTQSNIPLFVKILIFFIWLFNASVNMVYVYVCAVISLLLTIHVSDAAFLKDGYDGETLRNFSKELSAKI